MKIRLLLISMAVLIISFTAYTQQSVGPSGSGGSGSGFPLTASVDLAGFGMTNGSRYVAVVTNLALTTVTNAAIDASTASAFRVLLTQPNVFFPAPSNGQVEQYISVQLRQDSTGFRTVSFATNWVFCDDITSITPSTNKASIFRAVMVDPTNNVWWVVGFTRGYAQ